MSVNINIGGIVSDAVSRIKENTIDMEIKELE